MAKPTGRALRRTPARRPVFRAVLVATALVAAACGGGNGAGPDATSRGDDAGPGATSAAPGGSKFCEEVSTIALDAFDEAQAGVGTPADSYRRLADVYDEMIDIAPGEIRDDLALFRDNFRKLADAFEAGETPDISDEESAALDAAGARLDAYFRDECGIELDDEGDEYASDIGPFAEQSGTFQLFGIDQADVSFYGLELNCDYSAGVLTVEMLPTADDWGISFYVEGIDELRPGTYEQVGFQAGPPIDSPLGDEDALLIADSGTVTIEEVGEPFEFEGQLLALVAGSYSTDALYKDIDDSPAGSLEGTFRCQAYLLDADPLGTGAGYGGGDDGSEYTSIDEETGFVATTGGAVLADQYSGGTLCFIFDGEFQLDLLPDQADPVQFQFISDSFTEPGTYVGTAKILRTDGSGDKAETLGQVVVDSVEPEPVTGGAYFGGTLTAGFTEGPFGPVGLEIEWKCWVSESELENA